MHLTLAEKWGEREVAKKTQKVPKKKNIIFSDEKIFNVNDHGRRFAWAKNREDVPERHYAKFAPSLHVWGAIGRRFRMLVVLPSGTIKSPNYISNCLSPLLQKLRKTKQKDVVFMQDGAKAHTAKATMKWLADHKVEVLKGHPARSPDLNPIENLWAYLQERVSERKPTKKNLKEVIMEEFEKVPDSYLQTLVDSYEKRRKHVVAAKGGVYQGGRRP